jgi:hypothetical protein
MTLIKAQLLKAIRDAERHNLDVRVETVWLTITQMTELLRNIYKSGELPQAVTVAKFATVQTEGVPIGQPRAGTLQGMNT